MGANGDPTCSNPEQQGAAARLVTLFITEPELIRSMLEASAGGARLTAAQVLAAAREALRRQPAYADLYFYAAEAAAHCGVLATACDWLQQALTLNPGYVAALILSAKVATELGRPEQALAQLHQARALGADYPDVHELMGDLYVRCGEPGQARAAYERALQQNERLTAARAGLVRLDQAGSGGGPR